MLPAAPIGTLAEKRGAKFNRRLHAWPLELDRKLCYRIEISRRFGRTRAACSALCEPSSGSHRMKKLSLIGASALALGAVVGPHPALAIPTGRTVTANIADYNAAQVKAAGDIVTVPDGLATYNNSTGTLEVNSRFTVTLPAGFSFSSQPAVTDTGTSVFKLGSGGIGSQSATFTVTGAPLTAGNSVSLLSFAVQGVTALETPIPVAAALPITMQATNNAQILNNAAKPLSAPAFASEPGILVQLEGDIEFIDLSSPTLGTLFSTGDGDTASVAIVDILVAP